MEFNEKLQELRKQKGLTQEELAVTLFVSRTAISKWESGRGYPNIDSLKAIASFFSVSIDELLSSDELLSLAEEETKKTSKNFRDLVFGLIDISFAMFFFLPFFWQNANGIIQEVSLLFLTEIALYLKIIYFIAIIGIILCGILTLSLKNYKLKFWSQHKTKISIILNALGSLLFIVSMQPYAATFMFAFLILKVLIITKKQ